MEKDDEKSIDCVTEQEREYAQNALSEFNKGNYGNSLQHLNKLDSRTYDFKVFHNKAVVEYYKSDLKKTDAFQKSLTAICNQFHIRNDKIDDVDHCVLHYNQAVLLFHQRKYTEALRIMDRVYKFIEPMDDSLAKQVSLLFIELQICVRQSDKALGLITYMENHLLNANVPSIKLLDKKCEQKEKKVVAPVLDEAGEAFKRKLSKYKIRCFLLNHSLKIATNELNTLKQDALNVDVLFLKANQEYLQGNYEEAVKILTSIPNDCLLYNETGESSTIMFYNNMGAIHLAMGKPNMACHYFQKALKEDISINSNQKKENGDRPLYMLGGSKYHELMFNLGLALLHAGRATQAFDCLIIAVRRYHRNSRLWLRLAECCIMVHKATNEVDFIMKKKQKELISEVIGSKDRQMVVLTTNMSNDKKYSTESLSYAVPVATLEFASLCLRNAYLLLPSDTASSPVPLLLIPGITPPPLPPSPGPAPSAPLSSDGIVLLRNSILVASAYVSLCLGDYIIALEHAQTLLAQPRISNVHKLLAHLYAAESLVLLDKISEALDHLKPENVKDLTFELPADDNTGSEESMIKTNPPIKWFPNVLSSAHAVMQYNMAVAKTIRGQLDQAGTLLKQIWQTHGVKSKVPTHIIMLVLYIELQLGHTDNARSLIRQYSLQGL